MRYALDGRGISQCDIHAPLKAGTVKPRPTATNGKTTPDADQVRGGVFRIALTRRRRVGLCVEQFRECDFVDDGRNLLEQLRYVGTTIGLRAHGPDALHERVPDLGERPGMRRFGVQHLHYLPAVLEPPPIS